jgi:hypothetical protein
MPQTNPNMQRCALLERIQLGRPTQPLDLVTVRGGAFLTLDLPRA